MAHTGAGHQTGRMRAMLALAAVLAVSVNLAACGGGGSDTASVARSAPPDDGHVDTKAFKSCIAAAGVKLEREFAPKGIPGLVSLRLQVALGEADAEDPAKPGSFPLYAHVLAFDTPAHAQAFAKTATGDRFLDGEVHQDAYVGYNFDAVKVAATPNGSKFIGCLRNS